jgi:hypothetical protein
MPEIIIGTKDRKMGIFEWTKILDGTIVNLWERDLDTGEMKQIGSFFIAPDDRESITRILDEFEKRYESKLKKEVL